jgi:predicted transcriptional regulator
MKISTLGRIVLVTSLLPAPCLMNSAARAQDVPGIEICTVEKTMERRTSCLQSNIDFLQKTITKLGVDQQQRLDAANRQIEGLKGAVASLQKTVDDLRAAQKKTIEDQKKADAPLAKDNAAAAAKDAKSGVK